MINSLQQTTDGGYILAGYSRSGISGDKTQTSWGWDDYWIVKTDSLGIKQWDKRFGGTDVDYLYSSQQTTDGGYILGGNSYSGIGGDKTESNWGSSSTYDYWIVKTDSLGIKQWDKRFGGTDYDWLSSLQQTSDGGYILGGFSSSGISGDKTQPSWGGRDYWIVKTDSLGIKQWDKRFGGTDEDYLFSVKQTSDGGYILGGYSYSGIGGDKTQSSWGSNDYWIVKTDSLGIKQWDKRYGGINEDFLYSLQQTTDGGYILGGISASGISGDKTQASWGGYDLWIVKIDSIGTQQWDKRFGGSDVEDAVGNLTQTIDGGYLIGGNSYSNISGDKTENNPGLEQTWVVKTDSLGIKQWDKTIFTDAHDEQGLAIQANDGCFVMANYTDGGIGGYKTQSSWGSFDYWIVKFCDTSGVSGQLPESFFTSNSNSGCPNSCFDFTNASLNATTYQWFFTGGNPASSTQQNPSNICYANPGVYDVTLIALSNVGSDTLFQPAYITIFTPLAVSISQNGNFLTCNPAAGSYQWSQNGNQIPGATSQTLSITQTGMYIVDVTDANGCSAADTIIVNSISSPNFSATDTSLCEKFCIGFFDSSTNNPTAWQWIFPGGDPSSSTDQNPINICYHVPGIYNVTLITTTANGSDTLTLTNYITVYPTPPFPTITQAGFTLTSSPSDFYQWQLNSYDIPGATNQSYIVTQSGYYTVVVGDSNGCVNSVSQTVLIEGINDVNVDDSNISIYPNPSSGSFTVELMNETGAGEVSIVVLNTLGQKVFSSTASQSDGIADDWSAGFHSEKKQIDLSDAARGIYFVEIKTENKFVRSKFIIINEPR